MSAISDSSVAGQRFEETTWSVVIAAGADSSPRAHHALAELCRAYWPPIYGYLRRHGYDTQDAQDLTQSFFQHMLEDETLPRASRDKGRFRNFLLGALKTCLADEQARRHTLKHAGPRSVGIVFATNTVFVGNRDDLTVSVFDGSTCNGGDTTGCGQTPPAVLVGAFPGTGGIGNNILARGITIDSKKHIIYIPNYGDSDVAMLDADTCRAGHVNDCHVKIVKERAGGFPVTAAVDESTATVYVVNDNDGTVSVFPSSR